MVEDRELPGLDDQLEIKSCARGTKKKQKEGRAVGFPVHLPD
jgi:hypothetical protein